VDPRIFALYIGCSPEKETAALSEFERVVREVQEAGVTPEELERAKTYLEGALDIGMQVPVSAPPCMGSGSCIMGSGMPFKTI
jgi:predicted Zn-dependent peptidase